MDMFSYKKITLTQFVLAFIAMIVSFYMEIILKIDPCHICIAQRFIITLLMVVFLIELFLSYSKTLNICSSILLLLGLMLSVHHIHLMKHFDPDGQCLPNFSYLLSTFGVWEAFYMILNDPVSCSHIPFKPFGINTPVLILIFYLMEIVLWITKIVSSYKRSKPI